jgi:putative ABC transport system permease protein
MLGFYRRLLTEARNMPGVEGAAVATHLPFTGQGWGNGYEIEGRPAPPGEQYVGSVHPVSPGYFLVLGVPVLTGRPFQDSDSASAAPVAMINAKLAQRFWPDASPIGKRINVDGPWRTIVGVAADVKPGRLDAAVEPEIYLPYEQLAPNLLKFLGRGITIVVRSSALDPGSLTAGLRAAVRNADKSMAVRDVRTMPELIEGTLAQPRFRTLLLGIFSVLALLLATIGIYGVISYSVTQRVQEIGVRVALGASTGDIVAMVVRDAAWLAIAGVAVGLAAALVAGRSVSTLLFHVKSYDPITLSSVAAILLFVALVASFVPARRASRVDAMASLRNE